MKTLIVLLLITHIAAGITALLIGLVPMFSKKGSRLHNRTGLVYVYCMIAVAVTALLLCVLQPFKMMRLFLTGIAVLSFYLSVTGWRATKQKNGERTAFDRGLTYLTMAVSLGMIAFGLYLSTRSASFFAITFLFFGILTFVFARRDYQFFQRPAEKMHWFFQHITRMGGSYIATFTAALVTNGNRLTPANSPEWVGTITWIAPSIIGGLIISRTVWYYKSKFASKANSTLA
ncbi:DUF2306 domain-containing protein [Spirosoma soli]|uniref:DUF2306 domain-containing protein n=1 Tax=Spirosoma soli TaxID=1770529 RepID=A0ABW5M902_9BACT